MIRLLRLAVTPWLEGVCIIGRGLRWAFPGIFWLTFMLGFGAVCALAGVQGERWRVAAMQAEKP